MSPTIAEMGMIRDISTIADRMKSIDESLQALVACIEGLVSAVESKSIGVEVTGLPDVIERISDSVEIVSEACTGGNFQVRALLLPDDAPVDVRLVEGDPAKWQDYR